MKYLTFVDNINTFNLKNHQVLKLKFPSIKQCSWIFFLVRASLSAQLEPFLGL